MATHLDGWGGSATLNDGQAVVNSNASSSFAMNGSSKSLGSSFKMLIGMDEKNVVQQASQVAVVDSDMLIHAAQLETLQNLLKVENRIKDGAENLLNMALDVGLPPTIEKCDSSL
jgi:hypothetical protein